MIYMGIGGVIIIIVIVLRLSSLTNIAIALQF